MKLVYQPQDGERRDWTFDPSGLSSVEADAIEDAMGQAYGVAVGKLLAGWVGARRAFVWVMLRRTNPALRLEQVRFAVNEVWDEPDDEELERARQRLPELEASDDPTDQAVASRIREALAALDEAAIEEVGADVAGVAPGKDTAEPVAAVSST
jgi:hypothetical protein